MPACMYTHLLQDKRAVIEKARTHQLNQAAKLKKLKARLEAQGKAQPLNIRDNVSVQSVLSKLG